MIRTTTKHTDFTALGQRLSAAITHGDAVATDRAIRCARNRGDHAEAERLAADYWRAQGSGNAAPSAAHSHAAVLARVPLGERIGG